VCDLETSRIGTPYIYDISSLRVKTDQTLKMCTTTQNKVFKIVTDELLIMPKRILEQNPITARPKIYSLNKFKYNFPISCLSHKLLLSKQFLHQNNVRISCLPIQATCTVQHKHLDSITLTILQYMSWLWSSSLCSFLHLTLISSFLSADAESCWSSAWTLTTLNTLPSSFPASMFCSPDAAYCSTAASCKNSDGAFLKPSCKWHCTIREQCWIFSPHTIFLYTKRHKMQL